MNLPLVSVRVQDSELAFAVRDAAARVGSYITRTPIVRLPWLDTPKREVFAKVECWQRTGSFKIRGAYNALLQLPAGQPVIAASAGNHGLGVATVAAELHLPCKVCVPVNASELKVRRLVDAEAYVVPVGKDLHEAVEYATAEAKRTGARYISAYANREVIAGQGTCGLEIAEEGGPGFDAVVVPLGGGGLLAGIGSCLREASPGTRLVAVRPRVFGAEGASGGLLRHMTRTVVPTVADGLAVQVDPDSWVTSILDPLIDDMLLASEEQIDTAIYALLHNQGLLVEGAGAIGVAALLEDMECNRVEGRVLVVLSGGNISSTQLSHAMSVQIDSLRLRRLLGLRGLNLSLEVTNAKRTQPVATTEPGHHTGYTSIERDEPIWQRMMDSLSLEIDALGEEVRRHGEYVSSQELRCDPAAQSALHCQIELARETARRFREEGAQQEWRIRTRYRLLNQQVATLRTSLQWASTSQDQSLEVMFFDPSDQRTATVNYARYGSATLRDFELRLALALGFNLEEQTLLACSSGQAAYQVIESFLIRDVLRPGDSIAYSPYVYFEAFEQMTSIPAFATVVSPSFSISDLIRTVEHSNARVLFLDPVANTAGLPSIDLRELAKQLENYDWKDRWLVIDGTMISGGVNPFSWFNRPNHPSVLYYESGSKYLQLGLDLQMAGVCVFRTEHLPRLFRCRRNTGSIMYPADVARFPRYVRQQLLARMSILSRNAERLATTLQTSGTLASRARSWISIPLESHGLATRWRSHHRVLPRQGAEQQRPFGRAD